MTNKYVSDAIVAYQVPEPGEEPGEDMIEFLGTYPGDWDGDDFGLNFSFPGGVQICLEPGDWVMCIRGVWLTISNRDLESLTVLGIQWTPAQRLYRRQVEMGVADGTVLRHS